MANVEQLDRIESKTHQEPHSGANLDRNDYYAGLAKLNPEGPKSNPIKDGTINFSNIFDGIKGAPHEKKADPADKDSVQMLSDDGRKPAVRTEDKARHETPHGEDKARHETPHAHTSHGSHVVNADKLAKEAEAAAKANGSHDGHHAHAAIDKFRKDMDASMHDAYKHGGLSGVWDLQNKTNDILRHKDGTNAPFVGAEYKNGNVNFSLSFGQNGARSEYDFGKPIKDDRNVK